MVSQINNSADDKDLVQRFNGGDVQALSTLNKQYFLRLYYYTYNVIKDQQEARSIVSETIEKAWKIRANFKTLPDLRGFLYRVCYREACDYLKYGFQKKHEPLTEELENFQEIDDPDILSRIVRAEIIHKLYEELKKLPPQRQKVLQLFFTEGLTTKQVAQALNMKEQVVRSTKAQALEQLRKKLGVEISQHQLTLLLLIALQWQQHTAQLLAA